MGGNIIGVEFDLTLLKANHKLGMGGLGPFKQ